MDKKMLEFNPGDRVILKSYRNQIGFVTKGPMTRAGRRFYEISSDLNQEPVWYPEDSLVEYKPPRSVTENLKNRSYSGLNDFKQALIYRKLEKPLADNLYTFYSSKTEFQVHQFKPVMKFLNSLKQRLLLADEVGLGKTIEAGIIITEMGARLNGLARVLIVCPSMLTEKWEVEMRRRFGMNFEILSRQGFQKFLERYAEYGEAETMKGIVSINALRSKGIIDKMMEVAPRIDITVVDEAHHMRNPKALSSDLGDILSENSDALLFLSATPMQIGTPDLFNLLRILLPDEYDDFTLFSRILEPNEHINAALRALQVPSRALELLKRVEMTSQSARFIGNAFYESAIEILSRNPTLSKEQTVNVQKFLIELHSLSYVFTRTKKRDVATTVRFPVREAKVINVEFTETELAFYNAVTDFVAQKFTAKTGSSKGISFSLTTPQRQVASCIQAMKANLPKITRTKVIKGKSADARDEIDGSVDDESDWELNNKELQNLRNLQTLATKLGKTDTKYEAFVGALVALTKEDPRVKILVFAFFKGTLEYLLNRLSTDKRLSAKIDMIHGDVKKDERQKLIRKFRQQQDGGILLSSDVGGEGLDFEFCSVIFNYDLPWNPMRVEQRIGRLDRYGQEHDKIRIYNFSMKNTIDDEILKRLYNRINIFETYIGDLEAILGEQITELTRDMFNAQLTNEQKQQRIEKVAENIEKRKKDMEEFEKESQKFLGQDEYFTEQISRIKDTKRFITSVEVKFFLECFLKANCKDTNLVPVKSGRPNWYVLKVKDDFRAALRGYYSREDLTPKLETRMNQEGGMLLTFDYQEANKDDSLEFVTVHHPIVRAIKRYYDENRSNMANTAQLTLNGNGKYRGRYFFFIYLLEKISLKTDLLLVPVLVNFDSGDVRILDEFSDWFISEITNANAEDLGWSFDDKKVEEIQMEAEEYLGVKRQEEEAGLRDLNNTLINNQIQSIKQLTEIKCNKWESIADDRRKKGFGGQDRIVILYESRVRKLRATSVDKIHILEKKRDIHVGFKLICGGLASIV